MRLLVPHRLDNGLEEEEQVKGACFRLWPLALLPCVFLPISACTGGGSTPPATSTTVARNATAESTVQTPTAEPGGWKEYTNLDYAVSLRYPANWERARGYDMRYEGSDGFFALNAVSGGSVSLDYVCRGEAYHELRPYGTNPRIEYFSLGGVEACLIWPSDDQPAGEKGLSSLVLPYPTPVRVHCSEPAHFNYLILNADKDHIQRLADSLTFVLPAPTPSDCPTGVPGMP